jgi:hypothetical protein
MQQPTKTQQHTHPNGEKPMNRKHMPKMNKMPVQPVDRTPRPNNNIKNKLPLPMWTPTATDV